MAFEQSRETVLWFEEALLPEGWRAQVRIGIADGKICRIEVDAPACPDDERHHVALPGMPNLHSHAFQRGMAGLAERRGPANDSFWTWREVMYRFVDRIGPAELKAIATLAFMEMLESGFTRVGEFHYLHSDFDGGSFANPAEMAMAIGAAAEETGIALTLLPVFYAHAGFGGAEPGFGQRRFIQSLDGFERLIEASRLAVSGLSEAVVGIAPHSLRAVTPDELAALIPLAGSAPIHIHIAEQQKEVADCIAWSGARPVEWLLANAPVDQHWCLVHATHMTGAETTAMAQSGAVAGLCPITEANLGDGIFPANAFVSDGGVYGIGSDSNVLINAAEELRLLEYGQRLSLQSRNVFAGTEGRSTGGDLFRNALEGGNIALGANSGIAIGTSADLFSLERNHPSLAARHADALIDAFVFAARSDMIDCVWRHGAKLVHGGRHQRRDAIICRYRHALETIQA